MAHLIKVDVVTTTYDSDSEAVTQVRVGQSSRSGGPERSVSTEGDAVLVALERGFATTDERERAHLVDVETTRISEHDRIWCVRFDMADQFPE